MWKISKISSGSLVKAGFESEDDARDFLESKDSLDEELYDCVEMNEEEEEEYLELVESGEIKELATDSDEFEKAVEGTMEYGEYDDDYDGDDGILNEFEPDDDD